jgi:phytanoyl-CoA hydroxylase
VAASITPAQWAQYERDGFIHVGKLLSDADLAALQQRIDDIMLGKAKVDYERMLMQLDSESGKYEDAGPQTQGHKGATKNYRKIQQLEFDPLFLAYMQRPLFRDICEHVYGKGVPIGSFRAMFFNKPSHRGTQLPWHQDRWTDMDRDPLITIWTALDPATVANGCLQLIPGSHKRLINPSHSSGFLTPEQAAAECPDSKAVFLELKPGEVALLHNWTCHRSDVNRTDISRRAFSACYIDSRTVCKSGVTYPVLFGEGALRAEELQAVAR